jgi:uncharacterized protein (DUF1684 family)
MLRIHRPLQVLVAAAIAASAFTGCHKQDNGKPAMSAADTAAFNQQEQAWRDKRRSDLLKPEGWTSLIGLHWLDPGSHYIGSAGGNGIQLSMGPAHLGMVDIEGKQVRFVPDPSAQLTLDGKPLAGAAALRTDADPAGPSVIGFDGDKGHATVIERNNRYALRVKHADAPTRTQFSGIDYWPADPAWKIQAKFVPHEKGRTIEVANIIGGMDAMSNPGVVEFQQGGQVHRIEALDEGEGVLFLVFADRTNGHGSYGAGRFLDAPMPDANGSVTLDFNQSRNPPCAFTAFATCPLPPPENRLDLSVTAGEMSYHKRAHS